MANDTIDPVPDGWTVKRWPTCAEWTKTEGAWLFEDHVPHVHLTYPTGGGVSVDDLEVHSDVTIDELIAILVIERARITKPVPMTAGILERVREAIDASALLDPWTDAQALLANRDIWHDLAQAMMTTGYAFGFRAQVNGADRAADQTREWLMGFDFADRMFGEVEIDDATDRRQQADADVGDGS